MRFTPTRRSGGAPRPVRPARSLRLGPRSASLASLALVGALALGGCGSETSTSTSSTSSTSASSASLSTVATAGSADATTTAATIEDTAAAASAFLETLSSEQREQVLYAVDDETRSTSWSNFPVSFVQRAGLDLTELTEVQQAAAMDVLESLLSEEAYATVTGIIGGEEFLVANAAGAADSLGRYYLAFFGNPSGTDAWAVQFGGHHLGINASLDPAADTLTFAPTHLGVQPAVYTAADGTEVQPFDDIYSDAFAFFDSLTADQQATLTSGTVSMCAPGDTCDFATGSGLQGSELTDEQRALLLDLVENWSGMADEETTATTRAEIEATLDDTFVAWAGETTYDMTTGDGISFSISGPDVYVALQAQDGSAGADVAGVTTSGWGHVHTIYRDPTDDYAGAVTQQAAAAMAGPGGEQP